MKTKLTLFERMQRLAQRNAVAAGARYSMGQPALPFHAPVDDQSEATQAKEQQA